MLTFSVRNCIWNLASHSYSSFAFTHSLTFILSFIFTLTQTLTRSHFYFMFTFRMEHLNLQSHFTNNTSTRSYVRTYALFPFNMYFENHTHFHRTANIQIGSNKCDLSRYSYFPHPLPLSLSVSSSKLLQPK